MLGIFLFSLYLIIVCLLIYYWRYYDPQKWWIKIVTKSPSCIYYFGPFDSANEARSHQVYYLQDLQEEGAKEISIKLEQGQPKQLTIFDSNDN